MKQKVLVVTNYFPRKNKKEEGIFIYWLAQELTQQGFQIDILKWIQKPTKENKDDYETKIFKDEHFKTNFKVKTIQKIQLLNPKFRKKLHNDIEKNYDLIHFNWLWSTDILPDLKNIKTPYIITCHGSDINRLGSSFEKIFLIKHINKIMTLKQIQKLNHANHCIFVSKKLKETANKKGFNSKNYSVINNGINTKIFFRNKSIKKELLIGFVGNLIHIKRVDSLFNIFKEIKKEIPKVKFVIIGDGNLKENLLKEFKSYIKNKDVTLLGKLPAPDVSYFMNKMKVLLVPSRDEGFGNVIKEAQICGTSVVGTNTGGITEAIGNGGIIINEGIHFEKQFADAVVKLIQNPISEKQLIDDSKEFTWKNVANKTADIYKNVIL